MSKIFGDSIFRAEVAAAGAYEATIIPPGSTTPTQKAYKYAVSGMTLNPGDFVYVIPISGTYVLLGGAVEGGGGGGTADALPLAGGTMEGDIDMDGNAVTGLPTPTANGDAVPKGYIDSNYRTAAAQDVVDAAQDSNLATIESSPATQAHAVGDYIVYNGQLYKVTAAISPGETLTPGTNTAATNASESFLPKGRMIDITNQCQIGTGTIGYVRYYQTDNIIVLAIQVFNINFTGVNVWLRLPDSFPGNANVFTALATGFDGMVCVFRTQSGNGKYLLIQSTQQGSYNLTGTGICFA